VGIDLGDVVVKRPTTLAAFAGKRVAIDAWNILYQFLSSIRQPDGTPLMDAQGRVTSHLNGLLTRTANLVEAGIKPVYVFDGKPHPLKRETLAARAERKEKAQAQYDEALEAGDLETARTKAQQTSRLTVPMVEEAQALLRALGVPIVQAPGEGEAQAAWMAQSGHVDAAVSQDFDALLFGAPLLVRGLATGGRRKLPGKQVWVEVEPEEIPLAASLAQLKLTREQLVDCALLVGTDFHPGVKGIGAKKAVALLQKNGSLEALLDRLSANPSSADSAVERAIVEQHEALADRDAVRAIFLRPEHAEPAPGTLEMKAPDGAAATRLLVNEHGFNAERVESALARFGAARGKRAQTTLF
jgi:flap endonuclease-1